MYAQKESLAIDGKAMYFRGKLRISGLGLRPSDVKRGPRASDFGPPHLPHLHFREAPSELVGDDDRAVLLFIIRRARTRKAPWKKRRFSAALPAEVGWALAPVALLGLKAGVRGFANAALKGPLFHEASGVRKVFGTIKTCRHGFHRFTRIRRDKIQRFDP